MVRCSRPKLPWQQPRLAPLANCVFPSITGKDFDRLLKGHFFPINSTMLEGWKKGFDELFKHERREQQYSEVTEERGDAKQSSHNPVTKKTVGHIAKYCRIAEAPERPRDNISNLVCSVTEMSDEQLEQELTKRRSAVGKKSTFRIALMSLGTVLKVSMEEVVVPAFVDTGSQMTIISHFLPHKIFLSPEKASLCWSTLAQISKGRGDSLYA